eukprot:gnl/Spiro4/4124_TR2055_c0_g1_i1.p1 gnl/Spiro4/4124_TR2055_c0_g1~~gnl/Spiro4/4124_TR2055_c0_g1_i1.p1  ORF type:complete len:217 (+),score=40.62 gnl/Spiro4/4124_TR2055_c0_g1_i1:68-718(+)
MSDTDTLNRQLWLAAKANSLRMLKKLVRTGADMHAQDKNGDDALVHGLAGCAVDVVGWLLDHQVSVTDRHRQLAAALPCNNSNLPHAELCRLLVCCAAETQAKQPAELKHTSGQTENPGPSRKHVPLAQLGALVSQKLERNKAREVAESLVQTRKMSMVHRAVVDACDTVMHSPRIATIACFVCYLLLVLVSSSYYFEEVESLSASAPKSKHHHHH